MNAYVISARCFYKNLNSDAVRPSNRDVSWTLTLYRSPSFPFLSLLLALSDLRLAEPASCVHPPLSRAFAVLILRTNELLELSYMALASSLEQSPRQHVIGVKKRDVAEERKRFSVAQEGLCSQRQALETT